MIKTSPQCTATTLISSLYIANKKLHFQVSSTLHNMFNVNRKRTTDVQILKLSSPNWNTNPKNLTMEQNKILVI